MYNSPINQWKSQFMKPKTSRSNYLDWTYVTPMEQEVNTVPNYDTRQDEYESFMKYIDHTMTAPQGRKHRPKKHKQKQKGKKTRGFQPVTVQQNLQPIEQLQPIQQPTTPQPVPAQPQQAVPLAPVLEQAPQQTMAPEVPQQDTTDIQQSQDGLEQVPVQNVPAQQQVQQPSQEVPQTQEQPTQPVQTQGMYDNGDYEYDTYTDSEN